MNKLELAKEFRSKGWRVPNPTKWTFLEDREIKGKINKIYTAEVKSPDNSFGIVEIAVLDDGKENDEMKVIEMAKPLDWENSMAPFQEDLRDFLDDYEEAEAEVFATTIKSINVADELAEIIVYNKVTKDVTADLFVVRRRARGFKMKKIINGVATI